MLVAANVERHTADSTRKSVWFEPSGVLDHHRARAADLERLFGPAPKRVLELGAGAGGTAATMADDGNSVVAVDSVDDAVARLRAHGAELVGEVAQYEDRYRLCYLRGPAGIIVALAEALS